LELQSLVDGLFSNDMHAYRCLQQLEAQSKRSNEVYPFFDIFVDMLESTNSYIRTRGIILIAENSKWDVKNKLDEIVDNYLKHISDDKPIAARKCIQTLPLLVKHKPNLRSCVITALGRASVAKYNESMQPLILKDIQKALNDINNLY